MRDYHKLDVWQRAMDYTVAIYKFSTRLPDTERYNLTRQIRRAATSIPLNIAEGSGCATDAEFGRFVSYAYRSIKEAMTGLELCERLFDMNGDADIRRLLDEGDQIARMTHRLAETLAGK